MDQEFLKLLRVIFMAGWKGHENLTKANMAGFKVESVPEYAETVLEKALLQAKAELRFKEDA